MASAYKLDIDTSDLERASKLFSGIDEAFNILKSELVNLASLGGILVPVFNEIKNMADDTKDILMGWADAIDDVTTKMGKILSLIRNMAMTPINLFADALDFFNEVSEGGQTRNRNAGPLGTTADKLFALEKTEKIMDTGGAFITMMEALTRSLNTQQGAESFAKLGFTQDKAIESFKKGEGIEFLFDFLRQINSQIEARGGQYSFATKETMNDALGNILGLDIESFKSNYSEIERINSEYEQQYKNIKGTSGSLKKMRENTNRLSETFNTLKIRIADELYPIFDDIASSLEKNILPIFESFKNSKGYLDIKNMAKMGSEKIKGYLEDPNLINNLMKKIDYGMDLFKTTVLALMKAISYLPGGGDLKTFIKAEEDKIAAVAIGNFNNFLAKNSFDVGLKSENLNDPNSLFGLGKNYNAGFNLVDPEEIRKLLNSLANDQLLDINNNAIGGRKAGDAFYDNLFRFAESYALAKKRGEDVSLNFAIKNNNLVLRLDTKNHKNYNELVYDIVKFDQRIRSY